MFTKSEVKNWQELAQAHKRAHSTSDMITLAMLENQAVAFTKNEWPTANDEQRKELSAIEKTARLGLRSEFGKLVNQYAQKSEVKKEAKVDDAKQQFKRCPKCGQIIKEEAHACKSEVQKNEYNEFAAELRAAGWPEQKIEEYWQQYLREVESYTEGKEEKVQRCPDCGVEGELRGHMGCQYPSDEPEVGIYDPQTIEREEKISPKAQEWISNKISTLRHEGYPQEQSIAIAHSMARRQGMRSVPEKEEELSKSEDSRMQIGAIIQNLDNGSKGLVIKNIGPNSVLVDDLYTTVEWPISRTRLVQSATKAEAKPLKPGLPLSRAKPTEFTGDDYMAKQPTEDVGERKPRKKEESETEKSESIKKN